MTSSRDEERRASAYIASNKPLFQARNIDRKFFARSRVSQDEPVVSAEDPPSSRIPMPRKTSSPRATISLRDAYARAVEEEEDFVVPNAQRERYADAEGSPSPAPRSRPTEYTRRERDEQRSMRLRGGAQVSTASSLGQNAERDIVSPLEDDDTRSDRSVASDVSPEEEFTDESTNEIKQAANDRRRVAAALSSQNRLFTRNGLGTRVTETGQSLVKKSSVSSLEGEPAIRIPRTWGRNARKNPRWLNRISSPENSEEVYDLPQRDVLEGSIDWAGVAVDVPLPSVENGSSVEEPTPPHSRPNTAQTQITSAEKSHIWDPEFDFTAQSVQESTSPQLRVRNTKLDEIRAREIQALSKRAVATARLEEIKERNSAERPISPDPATLVVRNVIQRRKSDDADRWVQRRFRSASDAEDGSRLDAVNEIPATSVLPAAEKDGVRDTETKVADEVQQLAATSSREISLKVAESGQKETEIEIHFATESFLQDYTHDRTILEEEGEAIPGTPITIFKGVATKEKRPSQLGHSRDDSWENLRKLSRLTSATPSPVASRLAEKPSDESFHHLNRLSADVKRLSGASTPPKSDIDPEERIVSEVSLFDLQDDKAERGSLRTPSPDEDEDEDDAGIDETPRPNPDPLSFPTPIVTGAYIETPATRGRQPRINRDNEDILHDEVSRLCRKDFMRGSSSHSNTSRKEGRAAQRSTEHGASRLSSTLTTQSPRPRPSQRSRPPLINSAHPASAEEDLRTIQQEAEDSTLDDFDGLILAEAEDSDPDATNIMEPVVDLEKDDKGQPLSAEERHRRQDMLAIERMNRTIKSGLVSIRDAKRGIERLEDQVSSTAEAPKHNHDHHSCPKCASESSTSSFQYLTIPIPRLWSHDHTGWTGVRFTWIGLLIALLTAWYFLETVTCEMICHPIYASTNDWSPDDPFWGYALPTLFNRLSGGVLTCSFKIIVRILSWALNSSPAAMRSSSTRLGFEYNDDGGDGHLHGFASDEVL